MNYKEQFNNYVAGRGFELIASNEDQTSVIGVIIANNDPCQYFSGAYLLTGRVWKVRLAKVDFDNELITQGLIKINRNSNSVAAMNPIINPDPDKQRRFGLELTSLLNRYCCENESNTPDFILSAYLIACLNAFNNSVNSRSNWYVPATATTPNDLKICNCGIVPCKC